MMGPADQQCGRGGMDSLSVLRLQVGGNHENQTWARRGSQTALQFSCWLCSGEWALFLSLHGPFTITVEKGRNPQTHGRVQVLDKRNGSRESKNHYKDWQKSMSSGVWCVRVEGLQTGVAGSPEEFLVGRFCFLWSLGQNFLFRTRRSSRHQDLGLCKYTLYKEHHQFSF